MEFFGFYKILYVWENIYKGDKNIKKLFILFLTIIISLSIMGCSGGGETTDQGSGAVDTSSKTETNLGDYQVVIDSARFTEDFEGKDVVIIKYKFTNNAKEPTSFMVAFDDKVYQNGVGLNEAYVLSDSANYDSGNQTKEIKKGSTLDVEVAYELNDSTTTIEVEVEELFSFDDSKVTKKFEITK